MTLIAPGCCRHCGCNGPDRPCVLRDGDTCCWIDSTRTVCSSPGCINAEAERLERARRETAAPRSRFAGWGYGAVIEELRRERRKAAQRKGSRR